MQIGKKIKKLRNLCNLTQEELANRTELTKGYISQLENDLVEPSISTLEDIVNALGTNLGDFFKDEKLEDLRKKSNVSKSMMEFLITGTKISDGNYSLDMTMFIQ